MNMLEKDMNVEESIIKTLTDLFKDDSGPVLIAIGGPGGTGKSFLSKKLAEDLSDAVVFKLDDYKISREDRKKKNLYGPHPDANKMDLIYKHLLMIKNNQKFVKPVYNSSLGYADKTELYVPARFNIIDGEVSTYLEFKDIIDYSIFIESDLETQLNTRLSRDVLDKGHSKEKAMETFRGSNEKEFPKYGSKTKEWADIILFCNSDYSLRFVDP